MKLQKPVPFLQIQWYSTNGIKTLTGNNKLYQLSLPLFIGPQFLQLSFLNSHSQNKLTPSWPPNSGTRVIVPLSLNFRHLYSTLRPIPLFVKPWPFIPLFNPFPPTAQSTWKDTHDIKECRCANQFTGHPLDAKRVDNRQPPPRWSRYIPVPLPTLLDLRVINVLACRG